MKLSDAIKKIVSENVNALSLELIGLECAETTDSKTGEKKQFVRVDVEVSKGSGIFSRCQFCVKIPDTTRLKVSDEDLQNNNYQVFFTNLEVSYIDNFSNFYFRASNYDVEMVEG